MKGRIFNFAKYKAWNLGMITSRVNPRNTSRECARCHSLIVRYAQGQPVEGYTPGTPLCLCQQCQMRGNADRNASLIIGQRLIVRGLEPFKEKPHAPVRRAGRVEKSTGVALSQEAKRKKGPSISDARHGDDNAHGTAQEGTLWMDERPSAIPTSLRLPLE
jgi:putative transposase